MQYVFEASALFWSAMVTGTRHLLLPSTLPSEQMGRFDHENMSRPTEPLDHNNLWGIFGVTAATHQIRRVSNDVNIRSRL